MAYELLTIARDGDHPEDTRVTFRDTVSGVERDCLVGADNLRVDIDSADATEAAIARRKSESAARQLLNRMDAARAAT